MTFATLVWKNLLRRPARSLLTLAGIATGVAAVVALASVAWGSEKTWAHIYTARGTDLIVTKSGGLSAQPPPFALDPLREIQSLPGVAHASGVIGELMSIEDAPLMPVFGWESGTFVWDHLRLVEGRWPADENERVAVVGAMAADQLKKRVGAPIQLETGVFTICGIFDSASLLEKGAVVTTLAQLQRLTDQQHNVNFLNVQVTPGLGAAEIEQLRGTIMARWPGFRADTVGEAAQHNTVTELAKTISWVTSAIALVVGAVGVMNTMLMSVFERVQEIGILLAIGWRRRRILLMILYESIALSLIGGIAGIAVGTAAVQLLALTPSLRSKIESGVSPMLVGIALMISLGLGVLGGLYPAYRGSRMQPGDALRYE